jgi:hypothetical protein
MSRVSAGGPAKLGTSTPHRDDPHHRRPSWLGDHKLALGGLLALATFGSGMWWRRRQRRRIALGPMSEDWLRRREYDAGQRPHD